ncbi:MAG: hypothetical protein HXY50_17200 [Ignavibacteriaceae bacterium]|nr:hypothetical protein [Ignavibacteriaceae bacterium]
MRAAWIALCAGLGVTLMLLLGAALGRAQDIYACAIGGAGCDRGISAIPVADSGYAVVGWTDSFGAGADDAFVLKLTSGGSVVWARALGGPRGDWGESIAQTTDGGFVVAGMTVSFSEGDTEDLLLVKLSPSGLCEWVCLVGGSYNDRGMSVVPTPEGGCVVVGETWSYGAGFRDCLLVRFTAFGSVEWAAVVGGATGNEAGESVFEIADGGYIVTGSTSSYGAGAFDCYMIRFGASGSLAWASVLGEAEDDESYSVIRTLDGNCALTGCTWNFDARASDLLFAAFDGDGYNCRAAGALFASAHLPDIPNGPAPVAALPAVLTPTTPVLAVTAIEPQNLLICSNSGFDPLPDTALSAVPALRIAPNPFSAACAIRMSRASAEDGDPFVVEILDAAGRRIWASTRERTMGGSEILFPEAARRGDVVWRPEAGLTSGVYLVRATSGDGRIATQRVVYVK